MLVLAPIRMRSYNDETSFIRYVCFVCGVACGKIMVQLVDIYLSLCNFKRGVILTKDNLSRMNWNGVRQCNFCSKSEIIWHLFFECHYAKALLRAIHFILGVKPPHNMNHLFNSLSKQGGQNFRSLLLTGAVAVCWAIWLCRYNIIEHFWNLPEKYVQNFLSNFVPLKSMCKTSFRILFAVTVNLSWHNFSLNILLLKANCLSLVSSLIILKPKTLLNPLKPFLAGDSQIPFLIPIDVIQPRLLLFIYLFMSVHQRREQTLLTTALGMQSFSHWHCREICCGVLGK